MNLTSTAALKVPPEFLTELALRLEDELVVAQRYGYSEADLRALKGQKWFLKAIHDKEKELEQHGFTFKAKMGLLAEDLLVELWTCAKQSESGAFKLDVAKLLAKLADLEPRPTQQQFAAQGSGYQIVINIPNAPIQAAAHPSEVASNHDTTEPPVLELTPNKDPDPLGEPKPFIIPDFDLTSDLTQLPDESGRNDSGV